MEKDLRVARGVVREVDRHFDASERLRLGKWIDPDERERTIAQYIATALTAARAETWKEAIEIAKARESTFDGADSVVIDLEAAAGSKTKVFSREDEQKNLGR